MITNTNSFPDGLCIKKPNRHKKIRKFFTPEEDALLTRIMFEQPFVTWLAVALQIPGRTARQCRDRWTNYLSPQNKNAPWTVEEDNLLAQKYLELGSQWTIIAKYFDGRSENNVKNRWYTHIKHKLENQSKKIENLPPEITPRIEVATRKIPSLSAKPRFVFPPISTLDSSIPDFTQMNVIQRTTSNKDIAQLQLSLISRFQTLIDGCNASELFMKNKLFKFLNCFISSKSCRCFRLSFQFFFTTRVVNSCQIIFVIVRYLSVLIDDFYNTTVRTFGNFSCINKPLVFSDITGMRN